MPANTILLILLAAILALGLAVFQYYFKSGHAYRYPALFTFLRFIAIFSLLVLLINPKIEDHEYFIEKPTLVLAVDNSQSIKNFGLGGEVQDFVQQVSKNAALQERFDVEVFTFGSNIEQEGSLDFSESQTNIQRALKSLDQLYENLNAPTVLITDGNQTYGEDYRFTAASYSNAIIPVIVGDTTAYQDLSISRINTNKYAYINNRFPVELFINYSGNEPVESRLEIRTGSSTIFSENLELDGNDDSRVVQTTLPASATGVITYQAKIIPVSGEKDTLNNSRNFAVEVIDERTSVLVLSSILHPDLGALKKSIESNQQREVELHQMGNPLPDLNDYQLVILYQPDRQFSGVLERIGREDLSYWMITGPQTDWRFLNESQDFFQKEITGQTEEFFPLVNQNFTAFQFDDIGFMDLPPLLGSFGEIVFTVPAVPILYQKIQGIETDTPLLATAGEADSRKAVLFGTDIWKWRAASFMESGSFQQFDEFVGKLVQFLAAKQKKERLAVEHETFYYGNEGVVITAQYFDKNFQFDSRGNLSLKLTNRETEETQTIPFLLKQNKYQVEMDNLPASEYMFTVSVAGESLSKSGGFTVVDFNVEQQFGSANYEGLQRISEAKGEPIFFLNDSKSLVKELLDNNSYIPVQKRREKTVPLIDWYYLLGILAFSLSAEWFLRKYYGLI